MNGTIRCSGCRNDLLVGITEGQILCPVCGQVIAAEKPTSTKTPRPRHPAAGRKAMKYWLPLAIFGTALALSLGVTARIIQQATAPQMMPVVADTPVEESPGLTTMAESHGVPPGADWMLSCLERFQPDIQHDPQDFGVQMELASTWLRWMEEMEKGTINDETRGRVELESALGVRAYVTAAAAAHTRLDQQTMDTWLARFQAAQVHFGLQPLLHAAASPRIVSAAPMGSPLPGYAGGMQQEVYTFVIGASRPPKRVVGPVPGGLPRPPGQRVKRPVWAPYGGMHDDRSMQQYLADTMAIQRLVPRSAYGWRRHAELLIGYVRSTGQSRAAVEQWIASDLEMARMISRSSAARGTAAEDARQVATAGLAMHTAVASPN